MVLGLIAAVVLAHGSVIKAVAMIILGLLVGLVGTDGNTGGTRFTFGITELTDGIDVATLAIGIFGIGEIITNLTQPQETRSLIAQKITRLLADARGFPARLAGGAARHRARLAFSACCPAAAPRSASFAAYALEKKFAATRRASAMARSRAWPGRNPPTMPAPRPRSSRC